MSDEFSFDPEPVRLPTTRRSPATPKSRVWLYVAGGLVLMALGGGITALATRGGSSSSKKDGKTGSQAAVAEVIHNEPQNHAELLEYLNKRGANLKIDGGGSEVGGKPVAAFRDKDARPKKGSSPYDTDWDHLNNYILVTLHPDGKSASTAAAAGGSDAFAWGRFVFDKRLSRDDVFGRVRKLLTAR